MANKICFLLSLFALLLSQSVNATIISGKCGSDVSFRLEDDYTLYIEGNGDMENYNSLQGKIAPWRSYGDKILEVHISENITSIGEEAFYSCLGLTTFSIPNSVNSIGRRAFINCTGLISFSIPNTIMSIGKEAFYKCTGLTSFTIPNSVTNISYGTFRFCSGLTDIIIPNSVTSIDDDAFYGCSSLASVSIPNSVTSIGSDAFRDCSSLTGVYIPNSVTSIGDYVFNGCSSLTQPIYCGDILVFVPVWYQSFVIPENITTIGGGAFSGCNCLTNIDIGDSVTNIGEGAFHSCSSLNAVSIGNSVTSIGFTAFDECKKIKNIYWNTDYRVFPFTDSKSSINQITIGDFVKIVYDTFSGCENIQSISIGKNVKQLRSKAFGSATKVNIVTSYAEEPPYCYPNVFTNVPPTAKLKVYDSVVEAYKNAGQWSNFTNIELMHDGDKPTEVVPSGKCLAVTCTESKPNAWDSQIFINFPTLLEKGKSYTFTMNVRGSKVLEPKQGQWGPEAIQLILQDNNSSNRDEWGGPADLQYLAHFAVTTEWVYNITDLDGNTIVADGKYPYSRVLLNLGNYAGTLYIDNVRAIDENGTEVFCITFETPEEQALVENGWMNLPKEFVDAANSISSVSTDTTSSFTFNLYGQKANTTDGFRIQNGKVILVK